MKEKIDLQAEWAVSTKSGITLTGDADGLKIKACIAHTKGELVEHLAMLGKLGEALPGDWPAEFTPPPGVASRREDTGRCPKCGSPEPRLHSAVQYEGEVQLCADPFHEGPAPFEGGGERVSGGRILCLREAHRDSYLLTVRGGRMVGTVVLTIRGAAALAALRRAIASPHGEGTRSLLDEPEVAGS